MLKYKVLKHSMVGLKGSIVELPNDSQTEQRIELKHDSARAPKLGPPLTSQFDGQIDTLI